MDKIVNEYGKVYKTKEFEILRGKWNGAFYIEPSEELKSLSREEYEFAFPEAVNHGKFIRQINEEDKIPISLLYGEDSEDIINMISKNEEIVCYKNPNERVDLNIANDIEVTLIKNNKEISIPFEDLPGKSKDRIHYEISLGDSNGKIIDSLKVDNYIILGRKAPIEVEGTIDKLMRLFDSGQLDNTDSFKAALSDAGEYKNLKTVEQQTKTLQSSVNKAKAKKYLNALKPKRNIKELER